MPVIFKQSTETFSANNILWSTKDLIRALVQAALVSQTESHIDMAINFQTESLYFDEDSMSRSSIQTTLSNVKISARDLLGDLMEDLKRSVLEELEQTQYGAIVTGIKYSLAGDVTDIEVAVSVS